MNQFSVSAEDFRQIRFHLEQYFYEIGALCPYGFQERAVYRQAPLCKLPECLVGLFLEAGYRRNGNSLYRMACPNCRQCVPIKLHPAEFEANRNQKRVWKKNADVRIEVGPLTFSEEKIGLLDRFLAARYPENRSCGRDYYAGFFLNCMTETVEFRYLLGGQLIGLSVVDCGATWLNAVYFYFDPEFEARSPGTFNILSLVDYGRRAGMDELYLGFWIEKAPAMSYKQFFKPHYLLREGGWQRISRTASSDMLPEAGAKSFSAKRVSAV